MCIMIMSDGLSNSNFACLQFHPKRVLKFGSWSSAETRVPKTCKREYQKFISYIQQYLWGTMGHQTGDQALARQILCRVKKSFRCSRFGSLDQPGNLEGKKAWFFPSPKLLFFVWKYLDKTLCKIKPTTGIAKMQLFHAYKKYKTYFLDAKIR